MLNTKFTKILFLLFFLFVSFGYSQKYHFSVEYITKKDGLSNTEITSIVQDRHGFIWFGTLNGLNRFDGYSVKVYQNIPGDSTSLSDNSITSLLIDSQGDLWVGTENNGLSVYDRNRDKFINYTYNPLNMNSLSNQYVTSIKEDSEGNIWVGSIMGLNKYQRESKNFKRYLRRTKLMIERSTLDSLKSNHFPTAILHYLEKRIWIKTDYEKFCNEFKTLFPNSSYLNHIVKFSRIEHDGTNISTLEIDNKNNIWFGFEYDSIGRYNPSTSKLDVFDIRSNHKTSSNTLVLTLCWNKDQLWIGTKGNGIMRFDSRANVFHPYMIPFKAKYQNEDNKKFIKCIIKDSKGEMWIGSEEGLGVYDRNADSFHTFGYQNEFEEQLLSADISAILEDNQGNYWVASYQGGVNLLKRNRSFDHYKFHDDVISQSGSKSVSSVLEDSDGNLWIGYFTSGIDLFLRGSDKKISFNPFQNCGLGKGSVFKIFEDSKKNIWTGTYEGGLQLYDKTKRKFVSYNFSKKVSNTDVRGICEDPDGNLWIATHGYGVEKWDTRKHIFTQFKADYVNVDNSLASDWLSTIFCDSRGRIWAGSPSGLSVYDPAVGHFVTYNISNSNLSHSKISVILEDKAKRVWIGTENGLNLFDESRKNFRVLTTKDGLVNDFISGIRVEEGQDILWISTYNGLSRLDYKTGVIKNYLNNSGLQATEFSIGACSNGKGNRIYFGAKNGLISFYPKQISYNQMPPTVIITDFKLFNKSVPISENTNGLLTKHISETKTLVLPHDQNVISFEFTAINYVDPQQNTYAYKLEGFENDWNYVGTQRAATYTNLDPGHYTFRVKAANNDGIWNDTGTAVEITIKRPLWFTVWAQLAYFLLFIICAYFMRKAVLMRIFLRNKIELDEMKLRFFANISHELRTPLTLILGPLQQLKTTSKLNKDDQGKLVNMLNNNGNKLLRLVNQLMNIYEVDAGVMKLKVSKGNLVNFTKRIFDTFYYYAIRRNIEYKMSFSITEVNGFFDPDKLESILSNIISNAFKYSEDNSSIEVALSLHSADVSSKLLKKLKHPSQVIEISIHDKGKGISVEYQKRIFERFFRIEHDYDHETGTGIGLSLAKQLVKIHKGDIVVSSKVGEGSTFTILLPIDRIAYADNEISCLRPYDYELGLTNFIPAEGDVFAKLHEEPENTGRNDLPILLILDDSEDIRQYIRYCFKSEFNIVDAVDGESGLTKAFDIIPDIIICDVMLPGISGINVCSTLKKDWRTSHIPIILLTAKIGETYHLQGLEEGGADDYVTKPFNVNLLSVKIRNILSYRKKLKQVLQMELQCQSGETVISTADDDFMRKAIEIVEMYIDDLNFTVEVLGKELGLSQTNLYRKLQALVGLSANQFIKNIRLKRAAQIIEMNDYSVTEVAFKVGFADAKYFSKTFKKQFGMLPKDYGKLSKSNTSNMQEGSINVEEVH